jgi:hypothetical protein
MLKNFEIYFTQSMNQQNISNQPGCCIGNWQEVGIEYSNRSLISEQVGFLQQYYIV